MKQSHITTPRTLSECVFVTGYSRAHVSEPAFYRAGRAAVCIAACVLIGILVGASL
jgi:hypothetical protein